MTRGPNSSSPILHAQLSDSFAGSGGLFDRFGYPLMKSRSAGWIIEALELMACVQISADSRQRFGHFVCQFVDGIARSRCIVAVGHLNHLGSEPPSCAPPKHLVGRESSPGR
jgi:hypothetical protein